MTEIGADQPTKPAVVLLSGGLDSTVTLAIARGQSYACHAVCFDYGQRHRVELAAAQRVAKHLGVISYRTVKIDLRGLESCLGSALTDDIPVPKDRDEGQMASEIPVTYVPARNTIFLSYALALAEVLSSTDIFIGVNAVDYSGYPDCRPQYIDAYQKMANLATRSAVEGHVLRIHTPLIEMSKTEIVKCGLELGVDYGLTHSCYDPVRDSMACGRCDACLLRKNAFAALGMSDPVLSTRPASEGVEDT